MVPLEALTCVYWIQFKIRLFAYVFRHTEHLLLVYVPMNPLCICVERNFPCNTVWNSQLPVKILPTVQCLLANLNISSTINLTRSLTLGIRVQPDLQAIGFKQMNTLQCSIPATSPWLFSHPCVNFDLHRFYKDDTAPDIFRSMFYEICASYDNFDHCLLYTSPSPRD